MGTCNFHSMEHFDLWATSNDRFYGKICPECNVFTFNADKCEECGADLSDIESLFDDFSAELFYADLLDACQAENDNLRFFQITVKSGYYDGLQLYVELSKDADNAGFTEHGPEYLENDDAQYYFDMCRSKCIRSYESEKRKVNKRLEAIGKAYDLDKLGIMARFSNGETWYTVI